MESIVPYASQALSAVPRALAFVDSRRLSATRGCFDRTFWYYRTLTNFPGATWQQLMLPLALLWSSGPAENPFRGRSALFDAARAGLNWWCRIQKRNGAFDEWYLNEHSYCPTAFTTAAAARTVLLLDKRLPEAERERARESVARAAAWLERRFNLEVMNQNCAAGLSLWAAALCTGENRWRDAAIEKFRRLAGLQDADGSLPENGGTDLGYSTLSLSLLAQADALGAGEWVAPMARKLADLLWRVSGMGEGLPGRLSSRGTGHAFPHGVEHFASAMPSAAALAAKWRRAYVHGHLPGPQDVDDRYFAYFYFPEFVLAYVAAEAHPEPLPVQAESFGHLPESGFTVVHGPAASLTVSRRLGGALALERPGQPPVYHLGYEVRLKDGRTYSSARWSSAPLDAIPAPAVGQPLTLSSRARFERFSEGLPLVKAMIPFQIFVHLARWPWLAETFQRWAKRTLVRRKQGIGLWLERTIQVRDGSVAVRDLIRKDDPALVLSAIDVAVTTSVHSPSARQDPGGAFEDEGWDAEAAATQINREGSLIVEHGFSLDGALNRYLSLRPGGS